MKDKEFNMPGFDIGWPDWSDEDMEKHVIAAIKGKNSLKTVLKGINKNYPWLPDFIVSLLRSHEFHEARKHHLISGLDTPISFNDMHDRVIATIKRLQIDYAMSGQIP